MGSTIRFVHTDTGATVYAVIAELSSSGQMYNTDTDSFEAFNASNWGDYAISLTEQGDSGRFVFTMPAGIAAGHYDIEFRKQDGEDPAESDDVVDAGVAQWDGTKFGLMAEKAHVDVVDGKVDTLDGKADVIDGKVDAVDGKVDTANTEIAKIPRKDVGPMRHRNTATGAAADVTIEDSP